MMRKMQPLPVETGGAFRYYPGLPHRVGVWRGGRVAEGAALEMLLAA
jgi:hypothetical protein